MKICRCLALAVLSVLFVVAGELRADQGNRGAWGDQGDGTFKNPILPGDFSDPDVIRVGEDYYLITSTFQFSPGMAILHSKDMVNWRYVGHAIPDVTLLGSGMNWNQMGEYNRGVYAGSLRHHAGRFYMFTTTLHHGMFMTSAPNITGPWDPPIRLSARTWTDDNCPFWDDDGQAYMIFSTPGKEWKTRLVRMAPDGRSIDEKSEVVIDDFQSSEGNKLYKIDGTYYVFHNEVRSQGNRVGVMLRSKNIFGPYEKKEILHGAAPDHEREPNQGALVQAPDGTWWFFTHQGRGGFFEGRPTSLLPVTWIDGWPVPGRIDETGAGNLVWSHAKPIGGFPAVSPQSDDEFSGPDLGPQWEWNHAPRADRWSLTERSGWLRLRAFPPLDPTAYYRGKKPADVRTDGFFTAANTLTQRIMGYDGGEIIAKVDVAGLADGQTAGLALFHGGVCRIGVVQKAGVRVVEFNRDEKNIVAGPVLSQRDLWLRAVIDDEPVPRATFAYSLDGKSFTTLGDRFELGWANYRGSRLALYSFNSVADTGYLDIDWLHYRYRRPVSSIHP